MASLTSGFLNGKEAQAGASAAVQNAMQDLRAKAERQRVERETTERNEARAAAIEAAEAKRVSSSSAAAGAVAP